ncbi:MAG: FtsX-like permease family protein [Flavobacteriaceae bacterium]|nr:FtsX-like permease family protein [Flavobacteriaceae bacterium]
MKAIGSSRYQIFLIYITTLLLFGLFAGVLAVPLAGSAYADFVAVTLNFDILTSTPVSIYAALFALSLLLPVLLSFSTLLKGTKISVKDAFSDYGIKNNSGLKQMKFFSKFNLSNTFLLAIKNSLRNSKRLSVVIISMALGVAIFNTGFNVKQSLWELLNDLQNELQYDVQVVLNKQISKEEAIKPFETLQNVKSISTWNGGSGMIQTKLLATDKGAGIVALPYNTKLIQPKIIKGNWLSNSSELEVVINQQAWELYGYKPLNSNLNLIIGDSTITAKIVGIVEQFELSKIYIDIDKYDKIFNPNHYINTITFEAVNNDYENVVELKKQIEKSILSSNLHVVFVMSDVERVKVIYDHLNIILSVIVFLSFLVLLVSAVGMASATGISITERTREIGVMRAIGGTPKKIYSIFVSEGMIISFISIIIGLLLSFPLSQLASIFFGNLMLGEEAVLEYAFSPLGFFITIAVTIIFGWLASRLPARSAVKKSIREALAYE